LRSGSSSGGRLCCTWWKMRCAGIWKKYEGVWRIMSQA
jgi:hypothetical protein